MAGAKPTAGKTWHGDGIFSRPNAEGKSIYHVRVYWHGKDYVVKAGATMAQALKKKGQLEHEQAECRQHGIDWIPPSQKKVIKKAQVADRKAKDVLLSTFIEKTFMPEVGDLKRSKYYDFLVRPLKRQLGKKAISALKSGDLESYRAKRLREVSPTTVRKELGVLGTVLRYARKQGLLTVDQLAVLTDVDRPQEAPSTSEPITPDQEKALLGQAGLALSRVIRWMIGSGMDRGEVLTMTWAQVHEEKGYVDAPRHKSRQAREVQINATLAGILDECRKVRAAGGRVFLDDRGKPWTIDTFDTELRAAYKAAGLRLAQPSKCFRHAFVTRLLERGVPIATVAKLAGHSTSYTTERYGHHSRQHLADAMALLDSDGPGFSPGVSPGAIPYHEGSTGSKPEAAGITSSGKVGS